MDTKAVFIFIIYRNEFLLYKVKNFKCMIKFENKRMNHILLLVSIVYSVNLRDK